LRPRPRLTARKIVPHDFAAFHRQANELEFGDVGEGMARDRDQVGKFAGLNRSNTVLPAPQFCSVGGDRAKDFERLFGVVRRRSNLPDLVFSLPTTLDSDATT
jgi:hypothetical protein